MQEEEFDLLKEILFKDMEELDKNEGKKRKIKKPTSCPVFGWPLHGRNNRTKPVVDILEHRISKEHIIKDELVSCLRNVERGGKNQRKNLHCLLEICKQFLLKIFSLIKFRNLMLAFCRYCWFLLARVIVDCAADSHWLSLSLGDVSSLALKFEFFSQSV